MPQMLDFKEELKKYKPVLGVDDVESVVSNGDLKDIMDLLDYVTKKISAAKE